MLWNDERSQLTCSWRVCSLHPPTLCLVFCSSPVQERPCWLSRWALILPFLVFSSVHLFVPALLLLLHVGLPVGWSAPSFMLMIIAELSNDDADQDVLTTLAGLSGPSTAAVDEQNVPEDRNAHGVLPSPVTAVCMCCKTWSYWSYNHVCFPPPCRVPSSCGGLCSSPGGMGDSECHRVSFWPILNLPEWTLQALRALKGTLWWCLCYLCECCCREKKNKVSEARKAWITPGWTVAAGGSCSCSHHIKMSP